MNYLFLGSGNGVFNFIIYILIAILVLMVMITVHEFGHYITGKIFNFSIEEFSIGFGPKIFGRKKADGELFSIRAIPLGGYCAFKGEDEESNDQNAFNNKKPWQRLIVLLSGAVMNYLFALIIIFSMFFGYGTSTLIVVEKDENIVESSQTLSKMDKILKIEGRNIYLTSDIMKVIKNKKQGDSVRFTVISNGETKEKDIVLLCDTDFSSIEDNEKLFKALGIKYQLNDNGEIEKSGIAYQTNRLGFFQTIGRASEYSIKLAGTIFTILGQLFTGHLSIKAMGGTITTISVTASAIKTGGLWSLLNIASFIGVNLAVFNLLPFPALDGSRALFTLIEWIRKKPINRKVEGIIHTVGFMIIILFAIFVDIQRYI